MSDLGKVYAAGKEPMLLAGSAASNAAGAGVIKAAGKDDGNTKNGDNGHNYGDLAK